MPEVLHKTSDTKVFGLRPLEYITQPLGGLPLPPLGAPHRFELIKMIQYT